MARNIGLVLLGVLILFVFFGIIYLVFFSVGEDGETAFAELFSSGGDEVENIEGDDFKVKESGDDSYEGAGGGGGGGAGGAGGGGSGGAGGVGGAGSGCVNIEVSYSLKDLKVENECVDLQGEVCLNKKVRCNLVVSNYDDSIRGNFGVRFGVYEFGKSVREAFNYLIKEEFFLAGESKIFEVEFDVDGENANKEILCSFSTVNIPMREVC